MSSIAYITDKKMIEYHRLNGNHTMNFWKPSNTKKMSNFKKGDYLFFLAKGTEKGLRKEKGLIGYGKLDNNYILTFTQMWNKYGTLNGYPNKESLEEAIMKITKNHKLPEYLNCLYLKDVTFFQAPVYLSEIGLKISNKVESYIYLDKENMLNTSKLLALANDVGVDMWSSLSQEKEEDTFIKDAQLNMIANITEKLQLSTTSRYEETRNQKFCSKYIKNKNQRMIGKNELVIIQKEVIQVYLPCIVNVNGFMDKLQYILGKYLLFQSYIEKSIYRKEIELYILFNQKISTELKELLQLQSIKYKEG